MHITRGIRRLAEAWRTARQRLQDALTELVSRGREDDTAARTRITELRALIERSVVREMPDDGLVERGMMTIVDSEDNKSTLTFILGDRRLTITAARPVS